MMKRIRHRKITDDDHSWKMSKDCLMSEMSWKKKTWSFDCSAMQVELEA